MPRSCTVCDHPQRAEIDRLLDGGAPCTQLAVWFRLSDDALQRHKTVHLLAGDPAGLETDDLAEAPAPGRLPAAATAAPAAAPAAPYPLLDATRALQARTLAALRRAEDDGDLRGFLLAVRAARSNFDLLARLEARAAETPAELDLFHHPQWVALRTALYQALAPFPEARRAVSRCLAEAHAVPQEADHGPGA